MISTAGPGIEHLPPPAEVAWSWGCRMRIRLLGRGGQRGRFRFPAAPPGCSGQGPPPLPTRTSEPMTGSSMLGKLGSASWSSRRLFRPPWQAT